GHVVLDLVVAAAGADVERPRYGEAETDLRAGGAGRRVERDDVVLPRGVEVIVARHLGVGVVADVVVVVVLAVVGRRRRAHVADVGRRVRGRERARRLVRDDVHVVPVAVTVAIGA